MGAKGAGCAAARSVAARQQAGSRCGADGMRGVEVRAAQAIRGHSVEIGCGQFRSVATKIAVAKVVADHEHNIRLAPPGTRD